MLCLGLYYCYCIQDRRKGGGGGRGEKGPGPGPLPVTVLCHKTLLLLYIFAVHFYGNLSALKGYLQEQSALMTNSFHARNQTVVLTLLIYRNWFYLSESQSLVSLGR